MKMKKIGFLSIAALGIFSLAACGGEKKATETSVNGITETVTENPTTTEEEPTTTVSPTTTEDAATEFTVTYMDELGNTLKTETVEKGGTASFADITFKTNNGAGYYTQFKEWDKDKTTPITEDTVFTCSYYKLPYDMKVSMGSVKYHGSMKEITIPEKWDGYTITSLDSFSYTMNSKSAKTYITTVHLPDTVTEIKGSCFQGCTKLSTIDGGNITTIGGSAFHNCKYLSTIDLSQVTSIGDYAFYGCEFLSITELPGCDIPSNAFYNCSRITTLKFSEGTKTIGEDAFNCSGLTTVYLPESLESIGDYAFIGCKLSSVYIGHNLTTVGSSNFDSVTKIYYNGTPEEFAAITLGDANRQFTTDRTWFYSEEEPSSTEYKYFHFVDGTITEWE